MQGECTKQIKWRSFWNCPNCEVEMVEISNKCPHAILCTECGHIIIHGSIYPDDCLEVWSEQCSG